jgi:hypothetical protein
MSGLRAIAPAATLDREVHLALGCSLAEWCDRNAVSTAAMARVLADPANDPFGIRALLAADLGVTVESLTRAA